MKHVLILTFIAVFVTSGFCLPETPEKPASDKVDKGDKDKVVKEKPAPLPTGAFLKGAPKYSKWQVHFTYGMDKPPVTTATSTKKGPTPTPRPKATPDPSFGLLPRDVIVTFTKPMWQATSIDVAGRRTETWFDGKTLYLILPDTPQPTAIASDGPNGLPDFLNYGVKKPDFPDFQGMSIQTFMGEKVIGTKKSLVFKTFGASPVTVCIDSQTRLPVRWQREDEVRDFTFMDPPVATISLPDSIKTIAKAMEVVRENDDKKPPRGG